MDDYKRFFKCKTCANQPTCGATLAIGSMGIIKADKPEDDKLVLCKGYSEDKNCILKRRKLT